MATIINNPSDTTRPVVTDDSPVGMIVGLIVALVLIVLFVMYVVPSFRGASTSTPTDTTPGSSANINLTVPSGTSGTSGSTGSTGGSVSGGASAGAHSY